MTNDGALESSHQGQIVFAYLAGGRDNYKKNCTEGKQTVTNFSNDGLPLETRLFYIYFPSLIGF